MSKAVARHPKLGDVAALTVDLAIRPVIDQGGVEVAGAEEAGETPPVPAPACRHHLLRVEDSVAAPPAAVTAPRLLLGLRSDGMEVDQRARLLKLARPGSHQGWDAARPSESVAVRAEVLGVAKFAENLSVRGVAATDRVQRLLALQADETRLVVAVALRHHLLGVENLPTAPRAGVPVLHTPGYRLRVEHQAGSVRYTRLAGAEIILSVNL